MATTNIFYRIPSQRGSKLASIAGSQCTLDQFCNYIVDTEGLNRQDFILAYATKVIRPNSCKLQAINLKNDSHVDILIPLSGGKGGFGSLLRAIGAQIEKTTNRDACRDLSGRRLRDIKREEELIKLLALQEKLREEQKRRKKEKLERLKRKTRDTDTSTSIQELINMFDDNAYSKRRLEIGDIIDAAVQKGIINSMKKNSDENPDEKNAKRTKIERDEMEEEDVDNGDRGCHEATLSGEKGANSSKLPKDESEITQAARKPKTKKKDLWLGLEGSDDDP